MKIVISGASGFLGTPLRRHLADAGHEITQLVRSDPAGSGQARWDPHRGELDADLLEGVDTVINLAGAPFVHWPWTASYKRTLLDSRIETSRTLADTIARLDAKPALVNASGADYYGDDRGDERLDESSSTGSGFLASVVREWEEATRSAREAGARVVNTRTSAVIDRRGGPLKTMGLPFRLGLGGRVGSGRQWFPTISLDDYLAAMTRLATDDSMQGPYNLTGPDPVTNAEFTKALGRQLRRPTVMVAPAFALKAVMGDLATVVIGSRRVVPTRLLDAGFEFVHPDIESQLEAALD